MPLRPDENHFDHQVPDSRLQIPSSLGFVPKGPLDFGDFTCAATGKNFYILGSAEDVRLGRAKGVRTDVGILCAEAYKVYVSLRIQHPSLRPRVAIKILRAQMQTAQSVSEVDIPGLTQD